MPVDAPLQQRFTAALDALVAELKEDRAVLAAILCGSLSHDTVWARSDIDLVLVTVDDRSIATSSLSLWANDVNVHAWLLPRAEFRKTVEGSARNSFVHSLLAKGRLLYTHDETIARLCDGLHAIGERDTRVQLLRAGISALPPLDKARKWIVTRGDLDYAALWLLYAATPLAQIAVFSARRLADREVIPQALALDPAFFRVVYTELLNAPKTEPRVRAALDAAESYVAERASALFAPLLEHLREAGDARSSSELEAHFAKTLGVGGVTTAYEYLAHRGVIGKASVPARLTKRSSAEVQELAFYSFDMPEE